MFNKTKDDIILKLGDCPLCAASNASIDYKGTKICQSCYDRLTTTNADTFYNRILYDTIHTTDLCWIALKAQLGCNHPNKSEIVKLKNAMIKLLENLAIIAE